MINDCDIFASETMVWQCSTQGHEDLFQDNFASNNAYVRRDLWQFTTKVKKFSSWKNGVWPIGHIPIAVSVLVAFNQYQY